MDEVTTDCNGVCTDAHRPPSKAITTSFKSLACEPFLQTLFVLAAFSSGGLSKVSDRSFPPFPWPELCIFPGFCDVRI